MDSYVKRRLELNDKVGILLVKTINLLLLKQKDLRSFHLERKTVKIMLTKQGNFDLGWEVLEHFVTILLECKKRMTGFIM